MGRFNSLFVREKILQLNNNFNSYEKSKIYIGIISYGLVC